VQALQLNKMQREEGEKVSRQMKKLFERLEMLERREEERCQFDEVRGQIEEVMRKEDKLRET
jgi:hypothetical protein